MERSGGREREREREGGRASSMRVRGSFLTVDLASSDPLLSTTEEEGANAGVIRGGHLPHSLTLTLEDNVSTEKKGSQFALR